MTTSAGSLLVRRVRLVPVGGRPAPGHPVDVRIEAGRVTEVGSGLDGHGIPLLDGEDRWAIPGLWDHHVHFAQWAWTRERIDLCGTGSPGEVLDRVSAALPGRAGEVVTGYGYRSAAWAEQPTVAMLDRATGERPVVLVSGDGHNGWLNSAALRRFGVPPRTGPLEEADWFPVWARLGELRSDAGDAAIRDAVDAAAGRGLVGLVDMELARGFDDWPARFAAGIDRLRVRAATYADTLEEAIGRGLRTGDPLPGTSGLAVMGPLKVITDGSLNTRTAYCCRPYAGEPGNRGTLNTSREELTALMTRAHSNGLRVAAHAIGDAALTSALDAFAAAGARGSIEHAQLVTPTDLSRMAALGLVASVQPAHLLDDRDVAHALWPDRTERCFAFRSMLDAGVELALGSDAPVAPLDPWLAMAAAVHRSGDAREPWNAGQALTAAEALAASTDGAGTLTVGSLGDLVLLDVDPVAPQQDSAATAAWLRAMRPAATVTAGRITHSTLA